MEYSNKFPHIHRNLSSEEIIIYPILGVAVFCLLVSTCIITIGLYFSRKQRKVKIVIEKDNKGNEPPSQNDLDPHQHNTRIADHFLNDVTNQEDIENSNGCGNSVKIQENNSESKRLESSSNEGEIDLYRLREDTSDYLKNGKPNLNTINSTKRGQYDQDENMFKLPSIQSKPTGCRFDGLDQHISQ